MSDLKRAAEEMRRRARQHLVAFEHEEQAEAEAVADLLDAIAEHTTHSEVLVAECIAWIGEQGRDLASAILREA